MSEDVEPYTEQAAERLEDGVQNALGSLAIDVAEVRESIDDPDISQAMEQAEHCLSAAQRISADKEQIDNSSTDTERDDVATDGGAVLEPGDPVEVREDSNSPRAGEHGTIDEIHGTHAVVSFDDGARIGHAVGELKRVVATDGGRDVTSTSGTEWKFQRDDEIKEGDEFGMSMGGVDVRGSKYTVLRRLRDDDDGDRFYQVEKEDGGKHLYAAEAIEPTYRSVDSETDQSGGRE